MAPLPLEVLEQHNNVHLDYSNTDVSIPMNQHNLHQKDSIDLCRNEPNKTLKLQEELEGAIDSERSPCAVVSKPKHSTHEPMNDNWHHQRCSKCIMVIMTVVLAVLLFSIYYGFIKLYDYVKMQEYYQQFDPKGI